MKKCPFCAEEIQEEAIKCRYCGEWLKDKPDLETTSVIDSLEDAPVRDGAIECANSEDVSESAIGDICPDSACIGFINEKGICSHCGRSQEQIKDGIERSSISDNKAHVSEKYLKKTAIKRTSKINILLSIGILISLFLFMLFKAYRFDDIYYTLDYISTALGYLTAAIVIPLLIAVIAKLAKKRFWSVLQMSLIFIAIPFSLFMYYGAYLEYSDQISRDPSTKKLKAEGRKALTEIERQFSQVLESSTSSNGLPQPIQTEIKTSPESSGIFGELEKYIKEAMSNMVSLQNDYLLELDAIGWNTILDPARLKSDTTFGESNMIIKKGKEVVKKYKSLTDHLLEDAYVEIDNLEMDENLKGKMKDGFEQGMVSATTALDKHWSLEENVISEIEKIIALLSESDDAWVIENSQVYFYHDNDLDRFNSCLNNIQSIVQKQQAIHQQSISQSMEQLRSIKEKIE